MILAGMRPVSKQRKSQASHLIYVSWFLIALIILALPMAALTTLRPASAQPAMGANTISGNYVDTKAGYSITFPPGWRGFNSLGGPEVTSLRMDNLTAYNQTSIRTAMSQSALIWVFAFNKTMIDAMANLNSQMSPNDMSPVQNSFANYCTNLHSSFTTVNGMSAYRTSETCNLPSSNPMSQYTGGYMQGETVMVATSSHIIVVTYSALSSDADKKYHDSFTQSLATFRVNNTVDFMTAQDSMTGAKSSVEQVQSGGQQLNVPITSTSQVSSVSANSDSKTISFAVDGGKAGTTRVEVDKVMQGPYSVTVDGNETKVAEIADNATGQTYLTVAYPAAHHSIVISGTQIVPEFPAAVLLVVAGMLGLVVILARIRYK